MGGIGGPDRMRSTSQVLLLYIFIEGWSNVLSILFYKASTVSNNYCHLIC